MCYSAIYKSETAAQHVRCCFRKVQNRSRFLKQNIGICTMVVYLSTLIQRKTHFLVRSISAPGPKFSFLMSVKLEKHRRGIDNVLLVLFKHLYLCINTFTALRTHELKKKHFSDRDETMETYVSARLQDQSFPLGCIHTALFSKISVLKKIQIQGIYTQSGQNETSVDTNTRKLRYPILFPFTSW